MALTATLTTQYGETRSLYVRINNLESSNHGVQSNILFRGYVGQAEFAAGGGFVYEQELKVDLDVTQPLWEQAYLALKATEQFANAVDC